MSNSDNNNDSAGTTGFNGHIIIFRDQFLVQLKFTINGVEAEDNVIFRESWTDDDGLIFMFKIELRGYDVVGRNNKNNKIMVGAMELMKYNIDKLTKWLKANVAPEHYCDSRWFMKYTFLKRDAMLREMNRVTLAQIHQLDMVLPAAVDALELVIERQFDWDNHIPNQMLNVTYYKLDKFDTQQWQEELLDHLTQRHTRVHEHMVAEQQRKKTEAVFWRCVRNRQALTDVERAEI